MIIKTNLKRIGNDNIVDSEAKSEDSNQEFIGEEEQEDQRSYDEIAMDIAKSEWGENDQSVTFSVEQINGAIYHIAVKKDATVITWYEINVEEKTITEYY